MAKMIEKSDTASAERGRGMVFGKGQKVEAPFKYSFSWTEYPDDQTMVDAADTLTLEEQRNVRNAQRKAKARTAQLNVELDKRGVEKQTSENNDQIRLKNIYKDLLTAKDKDGNKIYTPEQAREVASQVTRVEWPDTDESDE